MRSRPYYMAHLPYVKGSTLVRADKLSKRQWIDAYVSLYMVAVAGKDQPSDKIIEQAVKEAERESKLLREQFGL